MNVVTQVVVILLISISLSMSALATDTAKEERWAKQVNDFLVNGKTQWLNTNIHKFLSIYRPAMNPTFNMKPIGGVILLHGRGVHPNWPQVIQPLRTGLPNYGWSTLSLQMPILPSGSTGEDYIHLFKEVPARIKAGLDYLSKHGINNVILIGHNLGSNMGSNYLSSHNDSRVRAFVGIGMVGEKQPTSKFALDNVWSLLRMNVPILNVYGSDDNPNVLASVDRLAFAISSYSNSKKTQHSQQIKINDANQSFKNHEDKLLQIITTWISNFSFDNSSNSLTSLVNHK